MPEQLPEIIYPAQVVGAISDLLRRVRQLEQNIRIKEQVEEIDGAEPDADASPSSPAFSPYYYYPVRVDSVVEASGLFLGRIMTATSASSKWAASREITMLVTVDVPGNLDLPAVNDIVGAFYTGNYAPGKARFTLFGAGGGKVTRCKITSISYDYLVVKTVTTSGDVTGDFYNVARPPKLQMSPWDDQTIAYTGYSLTFNTIGVQERSVTVVGGDDDGRVDVQNIIPQYLVGDFIFKMQAEGGTGIIANGEELSDIDINVDARAWSRVV